MEKLRSDAVECLSLICMCVFFCARETERYSLCIVYGLIWNYNCTLMCDIVFFVRFRVMFERERERERLREDYIPLPLLSYNFQREREREREILER